MRTKLEVRRMTPPKIYEGPQLYKLDSVGRLRVWCMQMNDEGHYRTCAGLLEGKLAVSDWTVPVPASQPDVKAQGEFEVDARYAHQLSREYHASPDTVSAPKIIEPMLAKTYDKWPGPGYAQPKLDGIRCIMTAEGMFSRQGQPIVAVPHLHAAAASLFTKYPDLVLDGELYNHDLREDFGAISSIVRKKNPCAEQLIIAENVMQYWVYDTVDTDSVFWERTKFLSQALEDLDCPWFVKVPTLFCNSAAEADVIYGEVCAAGYEGGVYRLDQPYELGKRSKALLKRKEFITKEFRVLAIEEGTGNWSGAAKRLTLEGGKGTFGAGIRGSYAAGKQLLKDWNENPDWWPVATATVRYFMLSPDGVPRFPVVIDFQPEGRQD